MASQYYKQLRSFHAVALTGGFTAAAQYLGIGQPTVTEQVQELEERFGIELFYRKSRRAVLSRIGDELFAITQSMFACEGEAMSLLAQVRDRRATTIKLGSVSSAIGVVFAKELRERLPGVEVELAFIDEPHVRQQLYNFELDLVISAGPDPADAELHRVLYRRSPLIAVVSAEHRWANRRSLSLHDLSKEQGLLVREPSGVGAQLAELCRAHSMPLPRLTGIGSGDALIHAVVHGAGVAVTSAVEYLDTAGTRSVSIAQATVYVDYYLRCLLTRMNRPALRDVLAQVRS
ncbi:LysR substrate-binding domain-containing protein [Caballeronia sp. LjRoot34]|uniref:LysR substrate-binding domain-containing protein n=1 Tax=Caballeronia sp. LjRoot34 TaxID=3342325 RepID=UPI003ED12FD9